MNQIITYCLFLFIFIIIYAGVNGYFIRSASVKSEKDRDIWHGIGWVLRALVLLFILYLTFGQWKEMILITLLYCNWSWTVYDVTINWIIGEKADYIGTTTETDVINYSFIWKGLLFLATVGYLIYYFV